MVVGLPTIIAQPIHGVAFGYMLRVGLNELFRAIPDSWDGFRILIQTEYEAVFFVVLSHEPERIEADIAVQLDTWFHTPIPLVLQHGLLAEEKPRLKSAHMPVACRISVDDFPLRHIFPYLASFVLVNEVGERPVLLRY